MSKEVISVFLICLLIYDLCPQLTNASKVKVFKALIKAKLLKGIGKGVTKIVIPFIIPIPVPKKFPMFMTTMSTIPISNPNYNPMMSFDNNLFGFDSNRFNNIDYKNTYNDNKMNDNLLLYQNSMGFNN